MKTIINLTICLLIFSCEVSKNGLTYPRDISEIKSIELSRPDSASFGKFAEIKTLTNSQIKDLLNALEKVESVGPIKYKPSYYIVFEKNDGTVTKLKFNNNIIKDYDTDNGYKIEKLEFLNAF